jgi:hypothetical protein
MYLPLYSGFKFAIAKTPSYKTTWHSCKEYAGRALGGRKPKRYVTVTIWNGYKKDSIHANYLPISHKAKTLENYLNTLSKKYGSKQTFSVTSVDEFDGCLRIRVPPAWCDNRITAHLFMTYVRDYIGSPYGDDSHLSYAKDLLDYAQKVGLDTFNDKMRSLNNYRYILGIVRATDRWKSTLVGL